MEEHSVIERLKRGDIGGLETLVRMHHTRAVRAADLIVRDRALAEDVEALRRFECEAISHAKLIPSGDGFAWRWEQGDNLAGILWPVAHSATELLTTGPLERVKRCAGCNWLFVDESKNRSRRWCSMEDCGTHHKMRRYVARRAAKRKDSEERSTS